MKQNIGKWVSNDGMATQKNGSVLTCRFDWLAIFPFCESIKK